MTIWAQIDDLYKKVNIEEIFIFQATVLKFGDLLAGLKLSTTAKFSLNNSKMILVGQKSLEHGF